jgi:ATP-binding protein involved in chromosome partitioning
MDPRSAIIAERLRGIRKIIAVAGGKGGVGKSSVASALALALADAGHRVGFFDLDFYGPSSHLILGMTPAQPREEKGIVPPKIQNIAFMSIVHYASDKPSPLRGQDISNAIIELFTITRWGELDYLIIDMPPGMGDATLDIARFLRPRLEFLIVTTPSRVALETVKKLIALLQEMRLPIIGVIGNMRRITDKPISNSLENFTLKILGEIAFDDRLEETLGAPAQLRGTVFFQSVRALLLSSDLL